MFNHVLKGLGFEAYTAGVRIRLREGGVPAGDFVGWCVSFLSCFFSWLLNAHINASNNH